MNQTNITEFHPSVVEKEIPFTARETMPFTQATHTMSAIVPVRGSSGIVIKGIEIGFYNNTTNQSATNYYTVTASIFDGSTGVGTALSLSGTTDTKTFTSTAHVWEMAITCNQVITDTTKFWVDLTFTPTNAPGTFIAHATLYYQRLG